MNAMKMPMAKRGALTTRRLYIDLWSKPSISAIIRRAERKAVSPDVIGATTTPKMVRILPSLPSVVLLMMDTTEPALLLLANIKSLRASVPPKKAIAIAAQIRAIIDSVIMAPKNIGRVCVSEVTQRAISGDCVA